MVNPDKINESEINLESTGLVDECLNRLSSTELNKIICSGLFQPIRFSDSVFIRLLRMIPRQDIDQAW